MASLKYRDKYNQVGFLKKPKESAGFAEIVDFLKGSHIRYALTHSPTIHDSLVKQFWQTATASTLADGTLELRATIDTHEYTIIKASVRSKLQLVDASGISMLPNTEIFEGMGNMGYPTDGSFTFWKSFFTPQWRFLVHHILHCISPKSGGWDQFGSNIATALICLSTGRVYNFSKLIFDGMVANLKSKTKFLMYPRFLQMILEIQTESKHPYLAVALTKKIFGNMKRGFRGVPRPLLPAMLPVVAQNAGQADQARTQSQPSSSTVPPPPTSQPAPTESTTIPPTLVTEPISEPSSPSTAPEHETMEHPFEQPSPEHQPSSPRQESDIPQTQAPTHTHEAEIGHMSVDVSEADYAQRMAQQRQYMATYLKNQGGWKLAQIKKLTDEELKEKFKYLMRSMERFVPMDTEKESRKRTGVELQTESSKKLKFDTREDVSVPKEKDKESVKREEEIYIKKPILRYTKRKSLARKGLQKKPESAKSGTKEDVEAYMEERVDEPSSEEFPMSLIPQGPAPAKIVKWQIIKTGKRGAYQIIREDNTVVVYVNFQGLLNDLTRDDLKELYRLMILKYVDNRPEEEFERVLWGDLKTMFDPPSEEDAIWKLPHQQQILNWRYFHSCSVHCLTVEAAHIYMLTEVKYPLPPRVCKAMLEKKLLGDRKDEVCYQLLKLIEKQAQQQ
ncbi:hypothetical protein Tco_0881719 [Tanacetum coccineum]